MTSIQLKLEVSEVETSPGFQGTSGVYQTRFTHPSLEGELILFHGKSREAALKELDVSLPGILTSLVQDFKDLKKSL